MKRHIHHISEIFWYNYFITKEIRLGNAKGLIHEYEERTPLDCGNFKNQGIVKLKKRDKINIGRLIIRAIKIMQICHRNLDQGYPHPSK